MPSDPHYDDLIIFMRVASWLISAFLSGRVLVKPYPSGRLAAFLLTAVGVAVVWSETARPSRHGDLRTLSTSLALICLIALGTAGVPCSTV
jgi:CHASE2 domain-containing sensor protein